MNVFETNLNDALLIQPRIFGDQRGFFFETYQKNRYQKEGMDFQFVQDNLSRSSRGTLRGLHFQVPPYAQGKLVYVLEGAVLDVIVDLRKKSSSYGHSFQVELSAENKKQLWVPPGFAHGFLVLSDSALFAYKCTHYYNQEAEGGILWSDPFLKIKWSIDSPLLSEKDSNLPTWENLKSPF
ncbi:MAG: dTDP-4-dehydrorhamnose 3,5-epimerase [Bacteroidota bacterium]|nr:dTDP-4-dehydrorhamnose 3,5-epimerase [Bacteroidota bacterium]